VLNENGKMEVLKDSIDTLYRIPPKFPLGGGGSGLVSTPRDYFRFAQMLLNGGRLDGVQILSRKTVELMTSDHLPAAMGADPLSGASSLGSNPLDRGAGFGFTGMVVVNSARGGSLCSAGSFGWGGAAGTSFWIDPKEDMTVLLFTHLMVPPYELHNRLDVLANQAIVE
jgi:CubicO group peptidase (beta-lactamase class C family)